MKTIIYLLIWMNCSCPSNNITLTDANLNFNTQNFHMITQNNPACDPRAEFVDSIGPILDQMAKEQKVYGIVQPRTVPDRIYKLTMKAGKVVDKEPVEIEPVIEKSKKWVEQEENTIRGFKVK